MMLVLAGCGGNDAKKAAPKEKVKVSLGMLRLTSSAPLFIAMDKGFFTEEGIEIEPQWFDAAHPIAVSTALQGKRWCYRYYRQPVQHGC